MIRLTTSWFYLVMEGSDNETVAAPTAGSWNSDWMRGLLPLLVLSSLLDGPSYGYAISATLTRHGFGEVKGGTLYPLLARHEASGYVTTQWRPGAGGPDRKYFALTSSGEAELSRSATDWLDFARALEQFFTREGNDHE